MKLFHDMTTTGHEQVVFCSNPELGLQAIIAIHDTTLGPSLGGVRVYDYPSVDEALRDVLRLSRHMTHKAAVAGLDVGGGKAVIIGDPSIKSEALLRAFGRHVESLGGRFITAEDMNTTVEDMNFIRRETRHVLGSSVSGGVGDPAPVTAWGLYNGIRACLEVVYGSPDVEGRTVAIQGVGNVGSHLAKHLSDNGANLLLADISERKLKKVVEQYGRSGTVQVIDIDDFCSAECDVLAPCAVGGVLNEHTIPSIKAPIIAGGANNQLDDEERDGQLLEDKGITFAPDYVVNAGGLIHVYAELKGLAREQAFSDAANIFDTVKRVINKAKAERITPVAAAERIAHERIEAVARMKRFHL